MRAAARPKIGDRATSDVVVRLRTPDSGRDEWLYCHSGVLAAGSGYFADRLSDAWPTCQILLEAADPVSRFGFSGALALLEAAAHLGCARTAAACADYLESAPWDEADEEEILAASHALAFLLPGYPCMPSSTGRGSLATRRPAGEPTVEQPLRRAEALGLASPPW